MHKSPINTPIMNASELIDGIEYNAYDANGKEHTSINTNFKVIRLHN